VILFAPATSETATPYLLHCRYGCGESTFITYAEYCRQIEQEPAVYLFGYDKPLFKCPKCGKWAMLDPGSVSDQ
jgi:hypothetical protein